MTASGERNVAEELAAIKAVADALEPLSDAARRHVIGYVADLLGFSPSVNAAGVPHPPAPPPMLDPSAVTPAQPVAPGQVVDIRSLKEKKQPRSASEMAALVAYYISELLPLEERRASVTSADVEKFFKQANYRLPSRVGQTLNDAARAGYFDVVERGQYKLNPVGYNLVVHGMPSQGGEAAPRSARPRKTASKRATKATARKTAAKRSPVRQAKKAAKATKRSPKKRA